LDYLPSLFQGTSIETASPSLNRIYVSLHARENQVIASYGAAAPSERALDREEDDVEDDVLDDFFMADEPGALLDEERR
jgi:hypothetical protein